MNTKFDQLYGGWYFSFHEYFQRTRGILIYVIPDPLKVFHKQYVPFIKQKCRMTNTKADLIQRVAGISQLTVYCHSCSMNQYIQSLYPTHTKRSPKGASQAERSYAKLASAAGLFLHIFPQQNGPSLPRPEQSFLMQMIHF